MSNKNFALHSMSDGSSSRSAVLGENLEHLIAVRKVDVKDLSSETGISVTNINNIRRSTANPTLETLGALASYFKLSVAELIESNLSDSKNSKEYALVTLPLLELNELETFTKRKWDGNKIAISVPVHTQEMSRIAVKLNNNSFSPIYEKDTLFVVNFEISCQDGDIAVLKIDESPLIIRRIFFIGNKIRIDYPTLLDNQPILEDKSKVEIVGVIEKIIKER